MTLLAFTVFWNAAAWAQAFLLWKFSGTRPSTRIYWLGMRHSRKIAGEADKSAPPLLTSAPGASLSRNQLAVLIAVQPALALAAIAGGIVMSMFYGGFLVLIGLTAGLGGTLSFLARVVWTLRLPAPTRFELADSRSFVRSYTPD